MNKAQIYFIVVLLCILNACDGLKTFEHTYTSYVYSYQIPDSLYLICNNTSIFDNSKKITVTFGGEQRVYSSNKEYYDSLGMKHNDMTYNKTIYSATNSFPHNYLVFDLVSIKVTSNADFDTLHPTGTLLNDIVQFTAYSPYNYIQRNYKGEPEKEKIDKLLSECDYHDFVLILASNSDGLGIETPTCNLQFTQTPTLAQQHTITVTILDDAGKTWEASIDMDWSRQ